MKVKMLTTAAGPDGVWMAGQVIDLSDDIAKVFVEEGYAEVIQIPKPKAVPVIETAAIEQPEKAVVSKKPKKRKKR